MNLMNTLYKHLINVAYRLKDIKNHVTVIHSFSELEEYLEKTKESFLISDQEGQKFLRTWRFCPKLSLPKDPFSDDYRIKQLELYEKISGKNSSFYKEVAQESHSQEQLLNDTYPYSTKDLNIVGEEYSSFGYWLKAMTSITPQKRVVEFGAGCGNLSLALARSGMNVTALDISQRYIDTIRAKAKKDNLNLECVVSDMVDFSPSDYIDVAIFCESFHHSDHHIKLMKTLDKVLHPRKGVIYFLGEPVTYFNSPWGVRLDAESIWAARQNGWLELGFDIRYFKSLLKEFSWDYSFTRSKKVNHNAFVIKATRA